MKIPQSTFGTRKLGLWEILSGFSGQVPCDLCTFKDVKCDSWEDTYDLLYQILRNEVQRHHELLTSDRITPYDKKYLEDILESRASESDMSMVFLHLSRMLHAHYEIAPIIIIDEYDTPIQQGHTLGYYDKVIGFMRNLFSGGLKDNPDRLLWVSHRYPACCKREHLQWAE